MATVTDKGVEPTTLDEYVEGREQDWKDAFGEDLNTDPDTPQAQLIGTEALTFEEADEAIVDLGASLDIDQAIGEQLDDLCSILSIPRQDGVKSSVNGVDMTGSPSAVIPAGSQAKLDTGEIFELDDDVTLDGEGVSTGSFIALETGPTVVSTDALNTIVTPVPGWETVNNPDAGTTGRDEELDFQYRNRYFRTLAINAVTPLDSVVAGVSSLKGVIEVVAVENDTDITITVQGVELVKNSISVAVEGGIDQDIGDEIRHRKTTGCNTNGDTTVQVEARTTSTGAVIQTLDINFYRVDEIATLVVVDIDTREGFPSNGVDQIKTNLLAYFNGSDQFSPDFELDGLRISEDVASSRLYTPVNRTPGHDINFIKIRRKTYPIWDIGTSYEIGNIVGYPDNDTIYKSLVEPNTGNQPDINPSEWEAIDSETTMAINLNEKATLEEDDITVNTN